MRVQTHAGPSVGIKKLLENHARAVDKPSDGIYSARPRHWLPNTPAQVVKLVDTLASGASARKGVEVQVLSWAPYLRRPGLYPAFFMPAHPRTKVLYLSAHPALSSTLGASMRLVLGTILKK